MVEGLLNGQSTESSKFETLARKFIGNNLWAKMRRTDLKTGVAVTFIVLFMLRRYAANDWGYKDVDESMGPTLVNCPLSFLDGLSPPSGVHDAEWRARVRDYHQRIGTGRAKRAKVGDYVGLSGCIVPYVKIEKLRPLRGSHSGAVYRLSRGHLDFSVDVQQLFVKERQLCELADYVAGWSQVDTRGETVLSSAVHEAAREELKSIGIDHPVGRTLQGLLESGKTKGAPGFVVVDKESISSLHGALQCFVPVRTVPVRDSPSNRSSNGP